MFSGGSEFESKVVLITGGGGGTLGPALARAYVEQGATVVLCDKRRGKSEEKATILRPVSRSPVVAFDVDVADRPAVSQMIQTIETDLGGVDIFIGNAAEVMHTGETTGQPLEVWDRMLEVNLTANFHIAQRILPRMVQKRSGNIIFIGSVASWVQASDLMPGEFSYGIAKNGLFMLTRVIAEEHGPSGIRCNGISPGLIESVFTRNQPEFSKRLIERTALRRAGQAQDIANLALFLSSDRLAGFITGETIAVSGGFTMRVG